MRTDPIIQTLDRLIRLHHVLHELALEKTEVVKELDIDRLEILISKENAHVKAILELEDEREQHVQAFLEENGASSPANASLAACVEAAEEEEKELLNERGAELRQAVENLQAINTLNQQLIQQSLGFVNLNMDLFMPKEESYTYQHPGEEEPTNHSGRSLFDSKA